MMMVMYMYMYGTLVSKLSSLYLLQSFSFSIESPSGVISTCLPVPGTSCLNIHLVMDQKHVSVRSIVKVPKCYVPHVPTLRVPVTEEFGDCSLTSDSSGSTGTEKDDNTDENKVNIRASSIPRPRAVISSPDNDIMIGNRNRIRDGRVSASKNGTVLQNRHAHCKVKSHGVTDIHPDTRKSKQPGSNDKIDPVGKKKVREGSIKSEIVPRDW